MFSENSSITFLAGYFPACLVTRCLTSTNPAPIGVSKDCEDIPDGTSCQVAWAVGFESANHTDLSCFAIGQLESNSVPPYSVCEEKKCVDVATSDSSMLAPDCTHLTSGDQCNVVSTAGYTGSASTLICTLDVVNGSVSLIGGPNCSATLCAVDGIPSGVSHDCDGIAFWDSHYANCSDCYVPVDVTYSTLSCRSNSFLVRDTPSFYSVCESLSCLSSALLDDDTVEGLDCSSLTVDEACVVTCAGGYTAA